MPNTNYSSLIVDFSGKLIYTDNQDLQHIVSSKNKDKLVNLVVFELKEDINDILNNVKNGETITWDNNQQLFLNGFKYCAIKISPIYNKENKIEYASITLSKEAEKKNTNRARIYENKFEHLFNNSRDAIFVTDTQGNFIEVNNTAIQRTGFSRKKFLSLNVKDTPIKSSNQTYANYFQELIVYGESTAHINYTGLKGTIIETEILGKKFKYNDLEAFLHVSREVSSMNKKHAKTIESIIQSEEKDRRYFSSEILDNLGPILSLNLMLVETYFDSKENEIKDEIVEKVKNNLAVALKITTELTQDISPQILTKYGLRPAFHSFISKINEKHRIKIELTVDLPERISEKIDPVLYRAIVGIVNYFVKYKCVSFLDIDMSFSNGLFKSLIESKKKLLGADSSPDLKPDINYQLKELNLISRLQSINGEIGFYDEENIERIIIAVPTNGIEI